MVLYKFTLKNGKIGKYIFWRENKLSGQKTEEKINPISSDKKANPVSITRKFKYVERLIINKPKNIEISNDGSD